MRHTENALIALLALSCLGGARIFGQETVIHSFGPPTGPDGSSPRASLLVDAKGDLFGTTEGGGSILCMTGSACGTVFELSPVADGGWIEKIIHNFGSGKLDGSHPTGPLVSDQAGNLYGTTPYHGENDVQGTVFELSPAKDGSWSETILYSFPEKTYLNPDLTLDAKGNVYGTTDNGGSYGFGTVFELMPSGGVWQERVLHSFGATSLDGVLASSGLVFDPAGNLFGTTSSGGSDGTGLNLPNGTVFELTPQADGSWTERILHVFDPRLADGTPPASPLLIDSKGNLYGTTNGGGSDSGGTVFELSPAGGGTWTEKLLLQFTDNSASGNYPYAGLTMDPAGNLYGTTVSGGSISGQRYGTVFKLTHQGDDAWTETILHNFPANPIDGYLPQGGVTFDSKGNLYGTTYSGGTSLECYGCGGGTVFEIPGLASTPIGTVTTLTVNPGGNLVTGKPFTLTAKVTFATGPGTPTGTVNFVDPAGGSLTRPLNSAGEAVYVGKAPRAGAYSLYAIYESDAGFPSSVSATITETVSAPPSH